MLFCVVVKKKHFGFVGVSHRCTHGSVGEREGITNEPKCKFSKIVYINEIKYQFMGPPFAILSGKP